MEEEPDTLKKEIGLSGVCAIALGAMISSGLFILPGIAFEMIGPSLIAAFALAGILNLPAVLALGELSTAMPKSAGGYFAAERSLGSLAGTVAGFINWCWIGLKAAFALVGIGTLAGTVLPFDNIWIIKGTSVVACLFFMAVNLTSVKVTGRLQIGLVICLIGILVSYIGFSLPLIQPENYRPFFAGGVQPFFAVTSMVFISFGGLTKVFEVSEEISNPVRNLPLGLGISFVLINVLYILTAFVTVGVLSPEALSGSLRPIAQGAEVSMGKIGFFAVAAGAFVAYATTGNAGILSASRSPMAMSRDGLAPRFLSRIHAKWGTPVPAILLTTSLMVGVVLFLSIEQLAKTASAMLLISMSLINISVIIMRHSGIEAYRPAFRMPFVPWLPIAAVTAYGFLIAELGLLPLSITAAFVTAAVLWYLFYVKARVDRIAAVVKMVRMILSRHINRLGLEDELLHISLERDEIELDRFDQLAKEAVILDVKEKIIAEDLFERIGAAAGGGYGLTSERMKNLLLQREQDGSTVIKPGLAIPHIIVEGEKLFELVLVRCREGAVFPHSDLPVQAAFVLIGSPDERKFHLQALMAVAYVVEEPDFMDRWMKAANTEQLRDIVLLTQRPR